MERLKYTEWLITATMLYYSAHGDSVTRDGHFATRSYTMVEFIPLAPRAKTTGRQ